MNPDEFRTPSAGRIHRSFAGHDTFVPEPLPPRIEWTNDLVSALSRADAALGELSGLGRQLTNPHLLIGPYVRREAVASSRIEGTRSAIADLFLDEAGEGDLSPADLADRREVRNYIRALEIGIQRIRQGRPITLNLILELHAELMAGVRGFDRGAGQFRTVQNWIGGDSIASAVFVPPPPELLAQCLTAWERFANDRGAMPDLIQCAALHQQFETIHPFVDGNGRIGRLLITLFLVERGRLSQPLLFLSRYIERSRDDYYDRLQAVRTTGDWPGWMLYLLGGVEQIAREAVSQAAELVDLRERWRTELRFDAQAVDLIDALFSNPYLSVRHARERLGVSDPTARKTIRRLEQAGVIREVTGRQRGQVWLAGRVLAVLDDGAPGR